MKLYQVHLFNITCGLEVVDGVVTHAAPILQKSVGLRWDKVRAWAEKKGGTVALVSDSESRESRRHPTAKKETTHGV